jgi:hypothetical protein
MLMSIAAWLLIGAIVWSLIGPTIRNLLDALIVRVRSGGAIKASMIELPELKVSPEGPLPGSLIRSQSADAFWRGYRDQLYGGNKNVFLAHRLYPSTAPNQLYDIVIYVVPHKDRRGRLDLVDHVEYYFGSSWGDSVHVQRG